MSFIATIKGFAIAAKAFTFINAPVILATSAVVGVAVTAYSAFKAGMKASKIIEKNEEIKGSPLTFKEKAKFTWRLWIHVAIEAALTSAGIILGHYIQAKRLAYMTEAANLLLASNQDLQNKLDIVTDKYPETKELLNSIETSTSYMNYPLVETDIPGLGQDLISDPFLRLKWLSSADKMQEYIAEAIEEFHTTGYLEVYELARRFHIKPGDIPKAAACLAWARDTEPYGNKIPRIHLRPQPIFDSNGYPIKGKTMYVVCYYPANTSTMFDMFEMNRPYGHDTDPWEEEMYCESDYDDVARIRGCESSAEFA